MTEPVPEDVRKLADNAALAAAYGRRGCFDPQPEPGWGQMNLPMHEPRWDRGAESSYMVDAQGYVMVRRPGCAPYVMTLKDWMKRPSAAEGLAAKEAYDRAAAPSTDDQQGGGE